MKKILGICLLIASAIIIATLGYLVFKKDKNTSGTATSGETHKTFAWGVNASAFQIDGYDKTSAQKQVDLIDQLGVNTVRITLERDLTLQPFSVRYIEDVNDDFVDRLRAKNKDIVMVVDGDIIKTTGLAGFDQESAGYQMGSYAGKRYKDKVKYFQIANEVTGTVVKPNDPDFKGETFEGDYGVVFSQDRYNSLLGWLKGLQRGIKDNDPDAKIVVTGHWHLHYIIDKLIKDGINPDIIGWAWYSDDGLDITKRDLGEGKSFNLIEKLKSFNRPVWIIETNSKKGSYNEEAGKVDENYQADFFKSFIPSVLATKQVDGIFAFTLLDTPSFVDKRKDPETHWGLVKVSKDLNGRPTYDKKKAFDVFSDFIKSN